MKYPMNLNLSLLRTIQANYFKHSSTYYKNRFDVLSESGDEDCNKLVSPPVKRNNK